ncbi:MAG: SH3 domain-containing protein [Ruminiclostridium sp.]|nr:SH3 domain-containing protein [Ruminiclostridium sp.]
MLISMKSLLLKLLMLNKKTLEGLLRLIFVKLPLLILNGIKNIAKKKERSPLEKDISHRTNNSNYYSRLSSRAYNNPDLMPLVMKSRKQYAYKPSVISSMASEVKKVVFNVLYVFFFPFRIFLRHKLALVFILSAVYVFLNFTNQGSILFKEYTGKEFLQYQTEAANNIKEFAISAWNNFKDFSRLDDILGNNSKIIAKTNDPNPSAAELYSVTAAKGLNIREAPDPGSEKVSGGSLAFGSIVTFLDKVISDSAGRTWYYIKAEDGRSGWVSAKYLTVKREG